MSSKLKNLIVSVLIIIGLFLIMPGEENVERDVHNDQEETQEVYSETKPEDIPPVKSDEPVEAKQQVNDSNYKEIFVDGGDQSGYREANVKVNIGFGDREYWAYTNEYGQLVRVTAKEIILQDETTEDVLDSGRYYYDEAKVPGTESKTLDEGHVIADSLGGVANAYNITPQNSTLNRHGEQAYMEKVIRQAGGANNFEAIITYPDNQTQIPSKYRYTYEINGRTIVDEFYNENPEDETETDDYTQNNQSTNTIEGDISGIDTNNNGHVSIAEAKAAGFNLPINNEHWLYEFMTDGDGDGLVGE